MSGKGFPCHQSRPQSQTRQPVLFGLSPVALRVGHLRTLHVLTMLSTTALFASRSSIYQIVTFGRALAATRFVDRALPRPSDTPFALS
jgi:hypothetical protein